KSSESVCIQGVWWKPEAEHTGVCENRKSAKLPECERLSPIYLGYVPDSGLFFCMSNNLKKLVKFLENHEFWILGWYASSTLSDTQIQRM
ncbi:hypothetical protein, partial [Listeria booriae]|uniref:hypothetical protein n=1 Tax=Listeria booriae TaxID=1552123 RepID=UPI001C8C7A85